MSEHNEQYDFDQRLADARVIYEGTHGITMNKLSDITGFSKTSLGRQSRADGWRKIVMTGVTEEATAAVERFRSFREWQAKVSETVASPLLNLPDEPTSPEQPEGGELQTAADGKAMAVTLREQVLDRHRREWSAPRAMSAEAIRMRDSDPIKAFERAKLAKITAETLKLVQDGERKAIGLDTDETPMGHVAVIERISCV